MIMMLVQCLIVGYRLYAFVESVYFLENIDIYIVFLFA